MRTVFLPLLAVWIGALGVSPPVCACSVPVFRYALEEWPPDHYPLLLFYRGELTGEEQALAERIDAAAQDGAARANVRLTLVNLDADPDPALVTLWEAQRTDTLPWLVVHMPQRVGPAVEVWSGALDSENVARLLDSPLRRELARRLMGGDSVVWVLLETGDRPQDDAAFAVLTENLARLETKIKLPEVDQADARMLSIDPQALRLKFSAVRVARDDPAERFFVETLLRVEPDLLDPELAGKPMAFPVFGRGRALYSLVGDGIAADVIEEACAFLAGACQCTVKAQNPGVDLLMAADWDRQVKPLVPLDKPLLPLAGLTGFGTLDVPPAGERPADVPTDAPSAAAPGDAGAGASSAAGGADAVADSFDGEQAASGRIGRNALLAGVALLVIVAAGTVALAPRQRT